MQGQEIELKAGLSADEARVILRGLKAAYGPGRPSANLRSIYFDTPAHHLKAQGLALRIRRDSRRFIQTVKAGRTGVGGFQQVWELDNVVAGFKPRIDSIADRSMREAVETATRSTILVPQFETRVRRTRWLVSEPHGEIEIALDLGRFETGTTHAPIVELELELKGGSPEALFELAEKLLGDTNADLSLSSKAARGYALSTGQRICARAIASKPEAHANDHPAGEAFQVTLNILAEAIAANLHATMVSDDPEGPHQLRVSLRRLRSALRLFAGILDPKLVRELNATARDLGRSVSVLRDSDVLTELVLMADAAATDLTLRQALDDHRAELRSAARQALRDRGATLFVLRLQRLAILGGWQREARRSARPLSTVGEKPLAQRWAKIVAMGDRLSVLPEEDRHELRKRLKEYRYMFEITDISESINFNIKILKKLQAALGALHDLNVLSSWSPQLTSFDAEERLAEIRRALLAASRQRRDVSLGRACRHWAALRLEAPR